MKALLLCAGFGTRLKSLTETVPKPMLPIYDKPMLEYTIRHLAMHGINEFVVNLHFMPEVIKEYFKDGSEFGVSIEYSYESEPLGTAGALIKAYDYFSKERNFLVVYGDIVTNLNYSDLIGRHISNNCVGTIVLHKRKKSNSIVEMNDAGLITNFLERPAEPVSGSHESWVNSGVYCFNEKVFSFLPDKGVCDFPRDIFKKIIDENGLYGVPLEGYRIAVDSPKRYETLLEDFKLMKLFDV